MKKGFTLIELLVVIGIIGILAAIVLVAVNPGRQFAQARDSQRKSDVLEVTNALYQFAAEHDGNLPSVNYDANKLGDFPQCAQDDGSDAVEIGTAGYDLANAGERVAAGAGVADTNLVVPTYIAEMAVDPSSGDDANTDYWFCQMGSGTATPGRVYVSAQGSELSTTPIMVLR